MLVCTVLSLRWFRTFAVRGLCRTSLRCVTLYGVPPYVESSLRGAVSTLPAECRSTTYLLHILLYICVCVFAPL